MPPAPPAAPPRAETRVRAGDHPTPRQPAPVELPTVEDRPTSVEDPPDTASHDVATPPAFDHPTGRVQPRWRRLVGVARDIGLWARDSGVGVLSVLAVLLVAIAGWAASFINLHAFAVQNMGLVGLAAWLVPTTFDGAAAGLSLASARAAINGRSAVVSRLLVVFFTGLSSWINYIHIIDPSGAVVAALLPPSAVALWEGVMAEMRAAWERRQGTPRPRLHPARWAFDPWGTWAILRAWVLELPLPEHLPAAGTSPPSPARAAHPTPASPPAPAPQGQPPNLASTGVQEGASAPDDDPPTTPLPIRTVVPARPVENGQTPSRPSRIGTGSSGQTMVSPHPTGTAPAGADAGAGNVPSALPGLRGLPGQSAPPRPDSRSAVDPAAPTAVAAPLTETPGHATVAVDKPNATAEHAAPLAPADRGPSDLQDGFAVGSGALSPGAGNGGSAPDRAPRQGATGSGEDAEDHDSGDDDEDLASRQRENGSGDDAEDLDRAGPTGSAGSVLAAVVVELGLDPDQAADLEAIAAEHSIPVPRLALALAVDHEHRVQYRGNHASRDALRLGLRARDLKIGTGKAQELKDALEALQVRWPRLGEAHTEVGAGPRPGPGAGAGQTLEQAPSTLSRSGGGGL